AAALAADLGRLLEQKPVEALSGETESSRARGRLLAQVLAALLLVVLVVLLVVDRVRLSRTVEALLEERSVRPGELAEAALTVSDVVGELLDESEDASLSPAEARFRLEQADRLLSRFPPGAAEEARLRRELAGRFEALGDPAAAAAQERHIADREAALRAASEATTGGPPGSAASGATDHDPGPESSSGGPGAAPDDPGSSDG
ncbi:MAG: hypothetical protein H6828_15910, partial [Planctomycetes bacterium]|nr:hypothetical protein [Planctomycetota bacterium]